MNFYLSLVFSFQHHGHTQAYDHYYTWQQVAMLSSLARKLDEINALSLIKFLLFNGCKHEDAYYICAKRITISMYIDVLDVAKKTENINEER